MRYLTRKPSGIWYFRYQIPKAFQAQFYNRTEFKRSLHTRDYQRAALLALKLELELRQKIADPKNQFDSTQINGEPVLVSVTTKSRLQESKSSTGDLKGFTYEEVKKPSIELEDVIASYAKEKRAKNVGESSIKDVASNVRLVHALIGTTNLMEVSRDDVMDAIELLRSLPKDLNNPRNKKYFGGMTVLEAIERNKELGLPTIIDVTAARYIQRCSSLYSWACRHLELPKNPFADLSTSIKNNDTRDEKDRKKPFSLVDLKDIFSHEVFTLGKLGSKPRSRHKLNYQYWVPLICLLSSMRPNECCQLRNVDVQTIDGVLCFVLSNEHSSQSLKNKTAKRTIPVHKQLIALGFQQYLNLVKTEEWLFPELTYTERAKFYGKVDSWFRRQFTEKMALTKQAKSFYSFRHTFIDFYAKNGGIQPIHRQLVGHLNGDITNDVYGSKFDALALKAEVDRVEFRGLFEKITPWIAL
ncbi:MULTISPECIES: site-specific integrase [unclassified Vibrio]|uniref:site-specific integrase n=1 Tax=unclassified Vibrio TaxID=2614977 RepID=UPI00159D3363|nr:MULTISPECIES: site-specific integrase [unclassified Vibrio]NVN84012.1 site-specific integrase [Vibrio sp. Scap16]QLE93853.1 site-specific integrase [Vibrio sp. Scap24]